MLKVNNIVTYYGDIRVLHGVSVEVGDNEIVSIIGSNGAGKSTLMNNIAGIVPVKSGSIEFDGCELTSLKGHQIVRRGIIQIPEGREIFPNMTVLENLEMGSYSVKRSKTEMKNKLDEMYDLFPRLRERKGQKAGSLSGGEQQMVAIARAVDMECKVLILDEPTSSLDDNEVEKLFGLMRDLKAKGVGIIFVTHFLDQVYEVCDKITVLRDGQLVGEYEIENLPRVQLVAKMLGKELDDMSEIRDESLVYHGSDESENIIEAEGLQSDAGIKPFNFHIKKGEVNGFAGLLGSGRSECVRAIFGADHVIAGSVKVKGKKVKITKPIDAMKQGIAYLPEDRKVDGIVGDLSVRENIILAQQVLRGFFRPYSKAEANKIAEEYIKLLDIKTASTDTPIKSLSGGNQQKVILARWLLTHPDYLILDEPTRGIDVGTKVEIQKLVLKLASEGMSVTFISSETDEMLRTCSRLIIMRDRKVVGEISGKELSQSSIMSTIAGGDTE